MSPYFLKKNEHISENKIHTKIFETYIKKKRGRKAKKSPKYNNVYDNTTFDNLQKKIQVHFLSFLINISNDAISNILNYKEKEKNFKK